MAKSLWLLAAKKRQEHRHNEQFRRWMTIILFRVVNLEFRQQSFVARDPERKPCFKDMAFLGIKNTLGTIHVLV
jgi:hypothetical protein